ncbi:MAG: hypothetical protein IPK93_01090 [Solirubrobacterales bacterium]|nr:hypothetical protein [Solirubrobacterales bacterium]
MTQDAVRTGFTSRLILLTTLFAVLGFGLEESARASLGPVVVSPVKDINPGSDDGNPLQNRGGIDFGGVLLFAATDGYTGAAHADELWRSDGTDAGTFLVKDIADSGPMFSSSPDWMTEVGGEVFFSASSGSLEGTELWKTDGTEAGTVLVKNINPTGFKSGAPSDLTKVGSTLYFLANSDDTDGQELWKSDGTPGGTVMVEDLQTSISPVFNLMAVGNRLFFTRKTAFEGKELWTYDGVSPGTTMVENIGPGAADGLPVPFTPQLESDYIDFGGILYFRANDGTNGLELWRSDGTALGTFMVKDISGNAAGDSMSFGASFAESNGQLFFAWDFGLQKTDGTPGGTVPVGTVGNTPTELVDVDGTLFLEAGSTKVFKSDGTNAGTQEVFDAGATTFGLMAFDDNLYLSFDDGVHGQELYRSDGTIGPPERLTDINPAGGSLVNQGVVVGDRLFFRGDDDGATGVELWSVYADQTAPQTTIDSGPAEGETIEVNSATFTFSSNEPGSTFTCSLDGGAPVACNSGSSTYAGLSEGPHTFSVAATDPPPYSNVDPTPATRAFTYTVPAVITPPPPPPPTSDTTAPKLRLSGRKKQTNRKRLVVKAACLDEACSLRATGKIKVKIFKRNGKVKKTKKLKLKKVTASRAAGKRVTLRLKLSRKARRLVGRALKRKKISKARIKVRATDSAGNKRFRGRTVKVIKKKRRSRASR